MLSGVSLQSDTSCFELLWSPRVWKPLNSPSSTSAADFPKVIEGWNRSEMEELPVLGLGSSTERALPPLVNRCSKRVVDGEKWNHACWTSFWGWLGLAILKVALALPHSPVCGSNSTAKVASLCMDWRAPRARLTALLTRVCRGMVVLGLSAKAEEERRVTPATARRGSALRMCPLTRGDGFVPR
jgi:hypothetical protein